MGHLFLLRAAIGAVVLVWAVLRPEFLGFSVSALAGATAFYLAVAATLELARRRSPRFRHFLLSLLLLLDGIYLAAALYATGGMQSPIRFLIYLQIVAVSLLASYRTGLKIAIWYSLLFFVLIYAQAAELIAPVDVEPGREVAFDQMPIFNATSLWLFALATSAFSAMNERELRQRRADLQALVEAGSRLDDEGDPVRQARIVLDGLAERFSFARGIVLGASDERLVVLAARGAVDVPTAAVDADSIVRRAWARHELLPVKELDPVNNPLLTRVLPGARHVLVSPMIADGRPIGAIVVEYRGRHIGGVERRVASVIGQFASIAALNLRNAVLLQHVQDLAERDSLTGAANRRMFQETLERILASGSRRAGSQVTAILFIDLDDFKVVNDTLGHAAGDSLLVEVTNRISGLVRTDDLVARLGGDEFAILTRDQPDLRRSRAMAERLVRELRAPYVIDKDSVSITVSIGIASAEDALDGASELVRNADVAMYMAKANGKAGFAVFDPRMHLAIREQHELSVELQRVVELDQLRLEYQPIVDLRSGSVVGLEALVRWEHPERGLIAPGRFIELAEENGAIVPIGRWVLGEACREVGQLHRAGRLPGDVFLSVNVSANEIGQPGFVDGVLVALREAGLPAERLMLEITETALLRATPQTLATLSELRSLGIRAVIDDFGTGYFSLSHLRQFPVDALKVASEFVHDAGVDSRSAALASAIVAMGRALDLTTVAEGIETADQAQRMVALGCVYGQGYYFAQPLGLASMEAELTRLMNGPAASAGRPRRATTATAGNLRLLPTPRLDRVTA
jgi:diguanylate cyclase (GGDEF)-like protein